MPIRVQGPDGATVEFPDDTAPEVMQTAMRAHYGYKVSGGQPDQMPTQVVHAGDQEQAPQRTIGQDLGRAAVMTGRNVLQGALGIPALVHDALIMTPYNAIASAVGSDSRINPGAQQINANLNAIGVPDPQPENATERIVSGIDRGLGGVASGVGVGGLLQSAPSAVASGVGNALASNVGSQVASATTGATSAELAHEAGANPYVQTLAGLAGGLAPSVPALAQAGTQIAMRGGEAGRQQVAQNIADFQGAGTMPTVGQATQNARTQGLESLLAKTPGAAGVMRTAANNQADQVSNKLSQVAENLSPGADSGAAGNAIIQGVSGPNGFVDRFKAAASNLYNQLDQYVPANTPIDISKTKQALADINGGIANAPQTSALMQNPKLVQLENAINADASSGQLPYAAVKQIRSMIGDQLSDFQLTSDVPRSKLNALYASLSDDMKQAADNSGPAAKAAWEKANAFYKAGQDRIDTLQRVVDKNGGPEAVFNSAMSGTKDGATTLNKVMDSLAPDQQKTISAAVINRLGKATPGQQNAAGDQFSMGTFLTNWNKLSPQAKSSLFDRYGPDFSANMDKVARVASNVRDGSKVYANPSGTSGAYAGVSALTTGALSLFTGHPAVAAALAAGAGSANLTARLMTNPTFVKFLAKNVNVPVAGMAENAANLYSLAQKNNDDDLKQAAQLMMQNAPKGKPQNIGSRLGSYNPPPAGNISNQLQANP